MLKLGVNIDHVATVRQARGGCEPSPRMAALEAQRAGADSITVHLREDRRHIQDRDVREVRQVIRIPLNLEMSLNPEIVRIALRVKPEKVCLVPERRKEVTTEGGLDICKYEKPLKRVVMACRNKKIEVSLFIDPIPRQIRASSRVGADAVELHTGAYAHAKGKQQRRELRRLQQSARLAQSLGLQVNAGHGLNYRNTRAVARIPGMMELNIGHAIVSRAIFVGMRQAVREMKQCIRRL